THRNQKQNARPRANNTRGRTALPATGESSLLIDGNYVAHMAKR
ncbi:hypothetical protein QFZ89_005926, partial [Paraburkholderia youngii]